MLSGKTPRVASFQPPPPPQLLPSCQPRPIRLHHVVEAYACLSPDKLRLLIPERDHDLIGADQAEVLANHFIG